MTTTRCGGVCEAGSPASRRPNARTTHASGPALQEDDGEEELSDDGLGGSTDVEEEDFEGEGTEPEY